MKKARVTVVIPTYNRAKFLPRAIRSILKQNTKHWKLLIVDDGSTDDTKKVVKRFLEDERIRYVRLKKNRGVSYALKKALSMVDTPFFVQLDADDWFEKKTIKACLKAMKKSSNKVAMVYGNEKVWKQSKSGKIKYVKTKKKRQLKGKYDFITYHPMVYPRFYRRKALRSVGGWTTKVPHGGRFAEDRQILLKLAGRYPFKWINKPLYNHLTHANNNSRKSNSKKYAAVTSYLYKDALKRWGNKYKPVFTWKKGRLKVKKLVKR
ncbi:glycosyltransferase family 2 protein [Ammoniphilus sp. YIM 78166]|uniref:glycosyltransferase family 2 protein n=1 Tax=Ammoniphilus sp. YIM 78166 TaxID=1644106 RepID=UPI00106FF42D|nr:glycosyltransferase family 2 protein [Ammoniphilus sp. YIM 78166]